MFVVPIPNNDEIESTTTGVNMTGTSRGFDPGGIVMCRGQCSLSTGPIELTHCVTHYISVLIAGIFIIEASELLFI